MEASSTSKTDRLKVSTYIKKFLVGFVFAIRVANSSEEVVLLVQHIVADATHVGKLHICVHVDLDDAVADGIEVLFLAGPRATVEDKVNRLVLLGLDGFLDVSLVLAEQLGVELDIPGFVDAVDITEASSNREIWRDGRQGVVDVENILRLGVKRRVVNVFIVDAVFFATSDANLHLEPLLHRSRSLKILGGSLDIPIDRFL